MKNNIQRSADYANVLQSLITSTKLLQEATESSTEPIPSGSLLDVAIDRLETIKGLKSNHDTGEELAEKIVYQVSTIFHEISRPNPNEDTTRLIRESIDRYTMALSDLQDALTRLTQRGKLGTSLMRGRDRRELQGLTAGIDTEFNSFMKIVGKRPTRSEFRRSVHVNPSTFPEFSSSPPGPGFARTASPSPSRYVSTSGQHIRCWPGTRVSILDEINQWATTGGTSSQNLPSADNSSNSGGSAIYWLADIPGSGKSVIAADLADEWREKGILGGHFDAGSHGSTSPQGFSDGVDPICQTWAEQLGSNFPELTTLILRALSDLHRSPATSRGFQQQLKTLILQPLKQLRKDKYGLGPQAKIIFVLDALDEYPPESRVPILQGLKAVNATHGIKFLIVSRLPTTEQDVDMMEELLQAPPSLVTRGNINVHSASNMADILLYLTAQFQLHTHQFQNHPQFRSALIEPTIRVLAKRSEGLMLWAKMAFEMLLAADNPTKMLLNLVEEDALEDMNGLYLELILQAQTKLNRLNDALAMGHKNTGEGDEGPKDQTAPAPAFMSVPPPPSPSLLSPMVRDSYPRNSLAMILSAIAYSKEALSVAAIAELTNLGIERTMAIMHLLTIVVDYGQSSHLAQSAIPPLPPLPPDQRARSGSKLASPSSFHPPQKRSRSNTKTRPTSFSPARRKMSDAPRPSNISIPVSVSPTDTRPAASIRSRSREKGVSVDLPHYIAASPMFPTFSAATDFARSAMVKFRHSTFGDWIRLQHPPTLLSCLTGKGIIEEDDLRFVVAPTKDSAHAMLAKGCLSIIRSGSSRGDGMSESSHEGAKDRKGGSSTDGEDADNEKESLAYACRYWTFHCTQLLGSLGTSASNIFMSAPSSSGSRWKSVRGDMLEFFTRRLLLWVDIMTTEHWGEQGVRGLKSLRDALQEMPLEENLKPVVDQLVQWTVESTRLLERPPEVSSIPEKERNPESSLVWKYYSDELMQRTATLEAQLPININDLDDTEPLAPPPPIFGSSTISASMSSSSQKSLNLSNRAPTPNLVSSSNVAVASITSDKAGITNLRSTVPSGDIGDHSNDEDFVKLLVAEIASQNKGSELHSTDGATATRVHEPSAATARINDPKVLPPLLEVASEASIPAMGPAKNQAQLVTTSAKPTSASSSGEQGEGLPPSPTREPASPSSMPYNSLFPSLSLFSSKFGQSSTISAPAEVPTRSSMDKDNLGVSQADPISKDQNATTTASERSREPESVATPRVAAQVKETPDQVELDTDKQPFTDASITLSKDKSLPQFPPPAEAPSSAENKVTAASSEAPLALGERSGDTSLPELKESTSLSHESIPPAEMAEIPSVLEADYTGIATKAEKTIVSNPEAAPAVPSKDLAPEPPVKQRKYSSAASSPMPISESRTPVAPKAMRDNSPPMPRNESSSESSGPVPPTKSTSTSSSPGKGKSLISFKKVQKTLLHRKSKDAVAGPKKEKSSTTPVPVPVKQRKLDISSEEKEGKPTFPSTLTHSPPSISFPVAIPSSTSEPNVTNSSIRNPLALGVFSLPKKSESSISLVTSLARPVNLSDPDPPLPSKENGSMSPKDQPPVVTAKLPNPALDPRSSVREGPPTRWPSHLPIGQPTTPFDKPIAKDASPLFPSLSLFASANYGQNGKSAGSKTIPGSSDGRGASANAAFTSPSSATNTESGAQNASTNVLQKVATPASNAAFSFPTIANGKSVPVDLEPTVADMMAFINFDDLGPDALSLDSRPRGA